jgi:hypothetical protein
MHRRRLALWVVSGLLVAAGVYWLLGLSGAGDARRAADAAKASPNQPTTTHLPPGAGAAAGGSGGSGTPAVIRREVEATRTMQGRHAAAIAELGLPEVRNPVPRRALAKEPIDLPPGNDLRLIVKFADDMLARLASGGALEVSGETEDLAGVMDQHGITFGLNHTAPEPDLVRLEARALSATAIMPADLPGMLAARTGDPSRESVLAAAQALQALPGVEFVTIESLDQPPPPPFMAASSVVTEDLTAYQTYRGPQGSNIDAAAAVPGIRGRHVRISHCEYSYDAEHEDLIGQVRLQAGFNNFVPQYAEDTDHGTAALGIMTAADNGFGMTGLVPEADVWFYADYGTVNGLFQGRAATLAAAAADSLPGDVIVAEMQDRRLAPAETDAAVWLVTRTATDAGIHVVAAAGNGTRDLDGADYTAYRARGSSGAIIVGAGGHRGLTGLFSEARGKLGFSTFGSRVDVQGPGENVATLGYGALHRYDNDPRRTYTAWFAGTSSATPVVAGLVAAIQSAALEAQARRLPPREMRNLLVATGLPQRPAPFNPMAVDLQRIGPLPYVPAALNRLLGGSASPPVILSVTATPSSPGFINLSVVTDAESPGDLTYQWEGYPGGITFGSNNTASAHTTTARPPRDGPVRLFVRAVNAAGLSSEAEVGIVVDNTPRELVIGPPDPWRTVNLGDSLTLWTWWRFSNPQPADDRTISTWQATQGGVITADSDAFGNTRFRPEGLLPGRYNVEATAGGVTVSAEVTVQLGENQVHIHEHPQSSWVNGSEEAMTLTASAYGRGDLTFQWYGGGTGDTTAPVGTVLTVTAPSPGAEHLATTSLGLDPEDLSSFWVRVTDESGNQADSGSWSPARNEATTALLRDRHLTHFTELGLPLPSNPAPRTVPAWDPPVSPPGQVHRLVVKFRDDLLARADAAGVLQLSGPSSEALQALISRGLRFARSHTVDDAGLARLEARALHRTGVLPPDLAGILHVQSLTDPAPVLATALALHDLEEVEFVSIESLDTLPPWPLRRGTLAIYNPKPQTPAAVTADRTASQFDYRSFAGMSFDPAVANFPAADGRHVRVSIIGYGVDFEHEDLLEQLYPQAGHEGFHAGSNTDTGTGIVGLLAAADNGFGLTGVAPAADFRFYADRGMVNGRAQGRVAALTAALAESVPGDVVLLAVQDANLGPAETEPGVWLVTRAGVDAGMHVVATAGQGNHNLDSESFASYRSRGDSGTILVGQGTGIDKSHLNSTYSLELPRRAVPGTPYGASIHLHGPGHTTGLGVLGQGNLATLGHGSGVNHGPGRTYDEYFGGGGAAAALVAGAVAAVSSAAEAASQPLSPGDLRDLLIETARPQVASLDRPVGPVPDVAAALNRNLRPGEPAVAITTLEPRVPDPQGFLSVSVQTSNPSGAALSYVWTIDDASISREFGSGRSSSRPTTLQGLQPGATYAARLTVVNANGMTAERSVTLPVVERVPTFVFVSLEDSGNSVQSGQELPFTATLRDQAGREYSPAGWADVVWSVDGGGTIDPQSGLFRAGAVGGTYTVTASVGDITGTYEITVLTPPLAVIDAPRNRVVEAGGQSAELAVTAAGSGSLTFQLYRGVSRDRSAAVGAAVTVAGTAQGTEVVFSTPPVDGVQHYWVEVTDENGHSAVSRETRVGVTGAGPKSRFADWQLSYGIDAERGGPRDSFANDGVPNLLKYALGRNPRVNAGAEEWTRPERVMHTPPGSFQPVPHWSFRFERAAGRTDATVAAEVSSDLVQWSTVTDEPDGATEPTAGREARRVLLPESERPGKVFFRLRAAMTE